MKVILKGFRCHLDETYEFIDGSLTLIKGNSGRGKTSIFQAINWALYGHLRGIYNNMGIVNICSVTLIFPDCIIYRQGRPGLLRFVFAGQSRTVYEDADAQNLINIRFGPRDLWKACSYLEQGSRCGLLLGSNSEKMDLLNQLSFSNEDPGVYIIRIDQQINQYQAQFQTVQVKFTTECSLLVQELTNRPIDPAWILTEEQKDKVVQEMNWLKEEVERLSRESAEQHRLQGSHDILTQLLKKKEDQLASSPEINQSIIDNSKVLLVQVRGQLEKIRLQEEEYRRQEEEYRRQEEEYRRQEEEYRRRKENHHLKTLFDRVNQAKEDLNAHHQNWIDYQDRQFIRDNARHAFVQEQQYQYNLQLCQTCQVDYRAECISDQLNHCRRMIDILTQKQHNDSLTVSIIKINGNLSQLEAVNVSEDDIIHTREHYHNLLKSKDVISCPICQGSLRYLDHQLVKSDSNPVNQTEIDRAGQILNQLTQDREKTKQNEHLRVQLDQLNKLYREGDNKINQLSRPTDPLNKDLNFYQQLVEKLSAIRLIELLPISSSLIDRLITFRERQVEYQDTQKRLGMKGYDNPNIQGMTDSRAPMPPDLPLLTPPSRGESNLLTQRDQLQTKLQQLTQEIETNTVRWHQYQGMQTQIKDIKCQLSEITIIPDIDEQYSSATSRLRDLELKIQGITYASWMTKRRNALVQQQGEINQYLQELTSLQRLHKTAIDVECQQLEEVTAAINTEMNSILSDIFDSPIDVSIKLYRQLKTDKRIKHSVNITINYRGADYDGVGGLSGGEGDRVSFALILALNRLSPSPILLLDECWASLDEPLRNACLSCLRTSIGGKKTILCVNHEDIEGHYDQVIRM